MDLQKRHKYQRKQRHVGPSWHSAEGLLSFVWIVFLFFVFVAFVAFIPQQFKSLCSTCVSVPHANPSWSHDYRILNVLERALQLLPGLNRAFDKTLRYKLYFCGFFSFALKFHKNCVPALRAGSLTFLLLCWEDLWIRLRKKTCLYSDLLWISIMILCGSPDSQHLGRRKRAKIGLTKLIYVPDQEL